MWAAGIAGRDVGERPDEELFGGGGIGVGVRGGGVIGVGGGVIGVGGGGSVVVGGGVGAWWIRQANWLVLVAELVRASAAGGGLAGVRNPTSAVAGAAASSVGMRAAAQAALARRKERGGPGMRLRGRLGRTASGGRGHGSGMRSMVLGGRGGAGRLRLGGG